MFKISNEVRRLTNKEKDKYLKDGYLTGLPVIDKFTIDLQIHLSIETFLLEYLHL